jgi:hypothetical protein
MIDARIFDRMSVFFDDLPGSVRAELSLVMVALARDAYIDVDEDFDYEEAARSLLDAPTRIHRLGKMITAIAVLDVYFASNPKRRIGALLESYEELCKRHDDASLRAARDRYVERLEAVESAQRQWSDLRANELTTAALSAALAYDEAAALSTPPHRPKDPYCGSSRCRTNRTATRADVVGQGARPAHLEPQQAK